jgi:hypothetical protein
MKSYGMWVGLSAILVGCLGGAEIAWAKPRPKPAEVIEPSGLEPILGPSPALRQEVESLSVTIPPLEIQGTPPNTQEIEFRITPVQGPGQGSGPVPD